MSDVFAAADQQRVTLLALLDHRGLTSARLLIVSTMTYCCRVLNARLDSLDRFLAGCGLISLNGLSGWFTRVTFRSSFGYCGVCHTDPGTVVVRRRRRR